MSPNDQEWIKKDLDNEKEWRREMWVQIKDLHKRFDSQNVRVYTISGGMAVISSILITLLAHLAK